MAGYPRAGTREQKRPAMGQAGLSDLYVIVAYSCGAMRTARKAILVSASIPRTEPAGM